MTSEPCRGLFNLGELTRAAGIGIGARACEFADRLRFFASVYEGTNSLASAFIFSPHLDEVMIPKRYS
jgi:hypothetical protein